MCGVRVCVYMCVGMCAHAKFNVLGHNAYLVIESAIGICNLITISSDQSFYLPVALVRKEVHSCRSPLKCLHLIWYILQCYRLVIHIYRHIVSWYVMLSSKHNTNNICATLEKLGSIMKMGI